jgi:3-methyladenine DNA glycosylase Mpg
MIPVDREPLYDLNDRLLGHSCSAVFDYREVLLARGQGELCRALGIDRRSRGVEVLKVRDGATCHVAVYRADWFQPV